jgi:hypothetical protein
MNYLVGLRQKIRRLRVEIAEIQQLNEQYRRQGSNEADAQAHRKRHERLHAIQQELAQLAAFGRNAPSVEEKSEQDCSHLHFDKKASQQLTGSAQSSAKGCSPFWKCRFRRKNESLTLFRVM